MKKTSLAAAASLFIVLLLYASLSDREPAPHPEADRYFRLAVEGSAVVRPQAARKLAKLGAPAEERLHWEARHGLERLGPELVGVLGRFDSFRDRLWGAVRDRDFPWRPAATRALADTARPSESRAFVSLLQDPLASIRALALGALSREQEPAIRDRLSDPSGNVRRAAVRKLLEWGDRSVLVWLLEDLKRTDKFFRMDTGRRARYASFRIVKDLSGDTFGYNPGRPDPVAVMKMGAGLDFSVLPEVARAGPPIREAVLGLELRSCRRGEFYLRWTLDDKLVVGTGNPGVHALPSGTVKSILSDLELPEESFWGRPGCDLEKIYVRTDPKARPRTFSISKGPHSVDGLRPAPLGRLVRRLVSTIPDADLRARVEEALSVLGGPVP